MIQKASAMGFDDGNIVVFDDRNGTRAVGFVFDDPSRGKVYWDAARPAMKFEHVVLRPVADP